MKVQNYPSLPPPETGKRNQLCTGGGGGKLLRVTCRNLYRSGKVSPLPLLQKGGCKRQEKLSLFTEWKPIDWLNLVELFMLCVEGRGAGLRCYVVSARNPAPGLQNAVLWELVSDFA